MTASPFDLGLQLRDPLRRDARVQLFELLDAFHELGHAVTGEYLLELGGGLGAGLRKLPTHALGMMILGDDVEVAHGARRSNQPA